MSDPVRLRLPDATLDADLAIPGNAAGLVAFAHGSGSSRKSTRNRFVAGRLNDAGLATLLLDLLTPEEDKVDVRTRQFRFDIPLLAARMTATCDWLRQRDETRQFPIGLFGASTGAAAAIIAAADRPDTVRAVVSRGGRPDLAEDALPRLATPTLLIVGGEDTTVIELNEQARARTDAEVTLEIVPGATHLFEEPGALERVADLATAFFVERLDTHAGGS
ncbi:MAG TPA: alpha/beta family hydrolase [Longimicrobiales bacterium]|nr:alpha/beta family hydrolase [Longimicrobiales bacterium]